jgi:hypothetical protein
LQVIHNLFSPHTRTARHGLRTFMGSMLHRFIAALQRGGGPAGASARSTATRLRARPSLEPLEKRELPATAATPAPAAPDSVVMSDALGLVRGPAWNIRNNRAFVTAVPPDLINRTYFNTPRAYANYVAYFHGVLRRWVAQADRLGITDDDGLTRYLGQRLQGYYPQVRKYLASSYPRQTQMTYRLLMAMNLAHGYYTYATTRGVNRTIYRTLHLKQGDCNEIADLLNILVRAQGIGGRILGQVYNFPTEQGTFVSNHAVVYAGGLWLDAQTNMAFALDFRNLKRIAPQQRLRSLLDTRRVFGFYNWYLQPHIRQQQLAAGYDGGIIAFYYKYYFEGIGQGRTQLSFVRGR